MLTKRQLEDMVRCNIHSDCSKCACNDICIRDVMNHLAAQTALAYREMLERLEWSIKGNYVADECLICGNARYQGHKHDCELAALLKESEVEHNA